MLYQYNNPTRRQVCLNLYLPRTVFRVKIVEQVMNSPMKLREATLWLQDNLTFDVDQRVHVFEVTIRVLGAITTRYATLQSWHSLNSCHDRKQHYSNIDWLCLVN